jgi:transposase
VYRYYLILVHSLSLAWGSATRYAGGRPRPLVWVEPLIAKQRPRLGDGRRPVDDRKVLCGIPFFLYIGIRCEWLAHELGFGCGMTCWPRVRDWNNAGGWKRLHEVLLAELRAVRKLGMLWAEVDSSHIPALKGDQNRPELVDCGRPGSKHHLVTDTGDGPPRGAAYLRQPQ